MTTKRKAYVRPVPSTWWKNLPFYRFSMLRERTAVPPLSFSRKPGRTLSVSCKTPSL